MIHKETMSCLTEHFNEIYFELHNFLLDNGNIVASRNGATIELLNFKTIIKKPIKRCVGGYKRDINVFFLLSEALWIFAGRRDVSFLDIFNSKLKQYSDDGHYYHAPYGWRLRNWGINSVDGEFFLEDSNKHANQGIDQIFEIITMLNRNIEDRRVVMSIWNPDFDLNQQSKDIPCISGNMRFFSPEGNFTIKQVYNYLQSGELNQYPIYCYDEKMDKVVLRMLNSISYSGKKKVIIITLQNGVVLKITSDHNMYKRIRGNNKKGINKTTSGFEILEARHLKVGDELLSDVVSISTGGYREHKNSLFNNIGGSNVCKVHREYYEFIFGELENNIDVHHIDRDKSNNSIVNLDAIDHIIHSNEHKKEKQGKLNPINKESDAKRRLRLFRRRSALRKNGWLVPHHIDDGIYNELVELVDKEKKIKIKKSVWNVAKIISIEEGEIEDVYDFNVPEFHNAMFENGVVIHNCNDMIMYKIRDGKLYSTIANRSNDLNLGLTTNVFQFSFINEIIARILNIGLGDQVHNSQSLHLYLDHNMTVELQNRIKNSKSPLSLYKVGKAIQMDFNFTASQCVEEKLRLVDFHINSIIWLLSTKFVGQKVSADDYLESLKCFSRYFYFIYKLLETFVQYKMDIKIDKKNLIDSRILAIETIDALVGKMPEFQESEYKLLAQNYFLSRLSLDKSVEEYW